MPRPRPETFQKKLRAKVDRFIRSLPLGRFEGRFSLEWIAPDLFRYHPDAADPFRYVRMDSHGSVREIIQPQTMETDGGSIPRFAQIIPGLSPWEYGPAYLIHDWEFEAYDRSREEPGFVFDKTFEEVNLTLAEAIWTLMKEGYGDCPKPKTCKHNVYTIYRAVMSPIGREIWER
jgi:hypothetical protein